MLLATQSNASMVIEAGYQDFSYPGGTGGDSEVTGEMAESKLWYNDGSWWASLWVAAAGAYHIHRLDLASQDWVDTGTALDTRQDTKADALWDGSRLYLTSHVFTSQGDSAAPGQEGRLFRYSYDSVSQTYSLDAGFPVDLNGATSKTLVLEKDSTNQLWVSWVQGVDPNAAQVMVSHTVAGDDASWAVPFALPFPEATSLDPNDISSVIAYDNRVGVFFSNSTDGNLYFASHEDGQPEASWTLATVLSGIADDQINVKALAGDVAGRVFAAVKTIQGSQSVLLLVCQSTPTFCTLSTDWVAHLVYDSNAFNPTRPIVVLDSDNRELHVLAKTKLGESRAIHVKTTSLDAISFTTDAIGEPFIKTSTAEVVNNVSSMKDNVTNATGLAAIASSKDTKFYLRTPKRHRGGRDHGHRLQPHGRDAGDVQRPAHDVQRGLRQPDPGRRPGWSHQRADRRQLSGRLGREP
jgi:hypothetical protein